MSALNQPQFRSVAAAFAHLERVRWPDGPICPHCGVVGGHYSLAGESHRIGLWKCKDCREQFTATVGTVFERSHIPLNVWLQAVYLLCSSKKGMSSHQLHRTLGVTYKTAWFMTHRIRAAMKSNPKGPLGGAGKIVEADETYWGTEEGKTREGKHGGAAHNAMNKVVALVERGGELRAIHVADVTGKNLKAVLTQQVHADSHLMTDSSPRYNLLKHEQPFAQYDQVNHSIGEYVRGEAHTNTAEGFFSVFKRGLIGTYHHVSSAHLHRYCGEFDFRYNYREQYKKKGRALVKVGGFTDAERTDFALRGIGGKRLTYRRLDAAA